MRVTLNLASRPFADIGPAIKRLRIAMGVMAVMCIGLGFGLHALHQKAEEARARDHSLDAKVAAITQERKGYEDLMRQPANAEVLVHAGALNQLFDEKAFSWTLAMEDLETVLPGGVQVSTLEPIRDKEGHITLHLRVIGPRDRAVDLVKNLEHSRRFILPRIVGENSESTGGPGEQLQPVSSSNRVNVDLLADYNPATSGEVRPASKAEKHSALEKTDGTAEEPHATLPQKGLGRGPGHVPSAAINTSQRPVRHPYTGTSLPPSAPRTKPNPGGPK
jgi:type IV pilus assembly protein PilN